MMDPVISGLSLESPCRPSLGKALLINPEKQRDAIKPVTEQTKQDRKCALMYTQALPSNGAPSLPGCPRPMGPSIMS